LHARVVTFSLPAERLGETVARIQQNTGQMLEHKGFQHGHWLYDRERGVMTSVVIFDSKQDADASWATMGPGVEERIRAQGSEPDARSLEVVHNVE
jgi:hypothetical protein